MKDKDYKKEIIKIMRDLSNQSKAADKKRDKEEKNDSFFLLTGKHRGLRIAIIKLHKLINKS